MGSEMPSPVPPPLLLDLGDFDAVGIATEIVISLRVHAIEHEVDAAATVAAPAGWHSVVVTARHSGHVVLGVRYGDLSRSRWHNISGALARREWDLDEDEDGATRRFAPGTEATMAAFELLAAVTVAGAPVDGREVTAVDGHGNPMDLVV